MHEYRITIIAKWWKQAQQTQETKHHTHTPLHYAAQNRNQSAHILSCFKFVLSFVLCRVHVSCLYLLSPLFSSSVVFLLGVTCASALDTVDLFSYLGSCHSTHRLPCVMSPSHMIRQYLCLFAPRVVQCERLKTRKSVQQVCGTGAGVEITGKGAEKKRNGTNGMEVIAITERHLHVSVRSCCLLHSDDGMSCHVM